MTPIVLSSKGWMYKLISLFNVHEAYNITDSCTLVNTLLVNAVRLLVLSVLFFYVGYSTAFTAISVTLMVSAGMDFKVALDSLNMFFTLPAVGVFVVIIATLGISLIVVTAYFTSCISSKIEWKIRSGGNTVVTGLFVLLKNKFDKICVPVRFDNAD